MEVLIDNKNIETYFGIKVLDYTPALGIAAERVDERVLYEKSGIDKNMYNIKYAAREFVMSFLIEKETIIEAQQLAVNLTNYMFEKGLFVLSLRDYSKITDTGRDAPERKAILCERSGSIVPFINIRQQNSLFVFKIGFKETNPNAIVHYVESDIDGVTITYGKGAPAWIYWGDGTSEVLSGSGEYSHPTAIGYIEPIIDIDKNQSEVAPIVADFSALPLTGIAPEEVQFADLSTGDIITWNWDFGDGITSDEQNPTHTYKTAGEFTVTLQVFNSSLGTSITTKIDYISIRSAQLIIGSTGGNFLINDAGDKLLIN